MRACLTLVPAIGLLACATQAKEIPLPIADQPNSPPLVLHQIELKPEVTKRPKNVILFIGDGTAWNALHAGTAYAGQPLVFSEFPVQLSCSTYPYEGSYETDKYWSDFDYALKDVTDSANSATAIASGYKSYNAYIGVGPAYEKLQPITTDAAEIGKSTGIVTSVPISHATPSSFLAHNKARDEYQDLARQMVDSDATVIIGAGHPKYDDDGQPSQPHRFRYISEEDYTRLAEGKTGFTFVESLSELAQLGSYSDDVPQRLFGLVPVFGTLQQGRSPRQVTQRSKEPYGDARNEEMVDLATLTKAALNILEDDPDGFFLMVEGGAIDWAAHSNDTARLVEEVVDFDKAIRAAVEWAEQRNPNGLEDVLILVTADHDCGYPTGVGSGKREDGRSVWYPIISRGPGKAPLLQWNSNYHANTLVPFLAWGAGAEAFRHQADETDLRLGAYLDNTEIAPTIRALWGRDQPKPGAPIEVEIENRSQNEP